MSYVFCSVIVLRCNNCYVYVLLHSGPAEYAEKLYFYEMVVIVYTASGEVKRTP
jgi:hypothetical protein